MRVRDERDDRMFIAVLLLLVAAGAIWWAFEYRDSLEFDGETQAWPKVNRIVMVAGVALALVAVLLHVTRPGIDEIDRRVAAAMGEDVDEDESGAVQMGAQAGEAQLTCRIDRQRSRIVGGQTTISTSPGAHRLRQRTHAKASAARGARAGSERGTGGQRQQLRSRPPHLPLNATLSREAMREACEACGTRRRAAMRDAANRLGEMQRGVLAALPSQPNERLVYTRERTKLTHGTGVVPISIVLGAAITLELATPMADPFEAGVLALGAADIRLPGADVRAVFLVDEQARVAADHIGRILLIMGSSSSSTPRPRSSDRLPPKACGVIS